MAIVQKNGILETYIVSRYSPRGNFIMRNWGESSSAARKRVYSENVQPLKPGCKIIKLVLKFIMLNSLVSGYRYILDWTVLGGKLEIEDS